MNDKKEPASELRPLSEAELTELGFPPEDLSMRAALDIIRERRRQILDEGFAAWRDDEYRDGQLSFAAACYALVDARHTSPQLVAIIIQAIWPWNWRLWKPRTPEENLIRAGALILAELERLYRARAAQKIEG